jgi:hypothetical protein
VITAEKGIKEFQGEASEEYGGFQRIIAALVEDHGLAVEPDPYLGLSDAEADIEMELRLSCF